MDAAPNQTQGEVKPVVKKSSNSVIYIVTIFVLTILTGYLGYKYYLLQREVSSLQNQLSMALQPTPAPVIGPNEIQLTFNADGPNAYMTLSDAQVKNNEVTYSDSVFTVSTRIGPGLCPMEDDGTNCRYVDDKTAIWGILRIWSRNGSIFAINPQNGHKDGVNLEGLIIQKTLPDASFSTREVNYWKLAIDAIVVR